MQGKLIALFMDGERFLDGKEEGHTHESDDALMRKVRNVHHELAQKRGWFMIDANQSRDDVHEAIWKHVKRLLD
ncbi:MAG TPA: hypothetical protein VJ837_05170 [Candidatus Paceibacterota bacterium]|nr:hypothetical protein [Candidatus Paceibacterota bacterium]